jgi:hypothetical protein
MKMRADDEIADCTIISGSGRKRATISVLSLLRFSFFFFDSEKRLAYCHYR